MTLPPRGHPDRIEAMAANVAAGLSPLHGDDGTAVVRPKVPEGAVRPRYYRGNIVNGDDLVNHPRLRYFGPAYGWWIVPEGWVPEWPKKPYPFLRDRRKPVYTMSRRGD